MRIGVISDTHIPENAPDIPPQIIEDFKSVDMIIHAGDIGSDEVLKRLKKVCKKVVAVWGNMDGYELRAKVPEKAIIEVAGRRIGLTHGVGAPQGLLEAMQQVFKNDKVDIVIFGHSHSPVNEFKDGVLYFNPGSPTDTVFAQYTSYGIIEINDKVEGKIIKL